MTLQRNDLRPEVTFLDVREWSVQYKKYLLILDIVTISVPELKHVDSANAQQQG